MEYVLKNRITHISTYGLALFLFLTPFEYPLADLIATSPLRIVGLIAMGMAFLDILLHHEVSADFRFLGVLFWLVYGFFTSFWVTNDARFQVFYSLYFNNGLMYLIFALVSFSEYEVIYLKKALIGGVGALLLYMTFVPNAVIYSAYQHRLTLNAGVGGLDQNYLAALMLIAFGLVFYELLNSKMSKLKKCVCIVYCLGIIYYIVLTGSRSGLMAIGLIVLLNINTSWKKRIYIGVPLVIILAFGLPILSNILSADLLERFSISALTGREAESGTRLVIWQVAIKSLSGLWFALGHGVGSSQTIVGNAIGTGKDMAIHNHYIAMLTEVGLIGFLFINLPIFRMLKRLFRDDKGIAISMLGIALMACFLDVVTTKFFWASLILLSASYSSCKNNDIYTSEW